MPNQAMKSEKNALQRSMFGLRNNFLLNYSNHRRRKHKEYVWLQNGTGQDIEILILVFDAAPLDLIRGPEKPNIRSMFGCRMAQDRI